MLTIALTGGIGSGKSTVARILCGLGVPVIFADRVGHAVYAPGAPAYEDLVAVFGEGILGADRAIDRGKLGAIVFADPAALARLNSIVHPRIFERMRAAVAEMRARGERRPIVVEAAILIEANWQALCDEIWLVAASPEQIIERLRRGRGFRTERAEAIIRAQLPDAERRRHAALVIENNGTLEELRAEVARLWAEALKRSR